MSTVTRIKCGNCHKYHDSAEQVKACHFPPITKLCLKLEPHPQHYDSKRNWTCPGFEPPVVTPQRFSRGAVAERRLAWRDDPITKRQRDEILRLGGDTTGVRTKGAASDMIDTLRRNPRKVSPVQDAPNRKQTMIPLDMLTALPDGYYASRPDETRPHTFFRISRPKSGNYKGDFKVQTQHGDDLKLVLIVRPDNSLWWHDLSVEENLLLVCVDPNGSAMAYADEIRHCMKCGKALTDERSRWFGIGPDCTKMWPHIEPMVEDRKGPFVHGWEKRANA